MIHEGLTTTIVRWSFDPPETATPFSEEFGDNPVLVFGASQSTHSDGRVEWEFTGTMFAKNAGDCGSLLAITRGDEERLIALLVPVGV